MSELVPSLPEAARRELEAAVRRIRSSRGLVVRASELLSSVAGSAVAAAGIRRLRPPDAIRDRARAVAAVALQRAFDVAVLGLKPSGRLARLDRMAGRTTAAVSGAASGFVGLFGLVPDITVTTLIIMRRIAAIAVEEGENLADPAARAACLEVFAFGGSRDGGDAESGEEPELGYWSARVLLQGRPLVMLLSEAAASYGLRISQKLTLQAIPLIGAAGGLAVNTAFLAHYEALARGHFVIRRLERTYGPEVVRQERARAPTDAPFATAEETAGAEAGR